MDTARSPTLAEQIAAAQAWWQDAGVDYGYADEALDWLAKPEAEPVPEAPAMAEPPARPRFVPGPSAPPPPRVAQDRSGWPKTLAEFAPWWLSEPALDEGSPAGRVPPREAAGAQVMAIVVQPEEQDTGQLLSGPQGRLLDAMLSAMGIAPAQCHVASALPRHTPLPDWQALAEAGLGEVLQHHIGLVAPVRVVLFGDRLPSLLGHDPTQDAAKNFEIALEGGPVPVLAARDLAHLLERPAWRAAFWRSWLDWSKGG